MSDTGDGEQFEGTSNRIGFSTGAATAVSDSSSSGLPSELLTMDPLMLQKFQEFLRGENTAVTPMPSIDDTGAARSVAILSQHYY